MMSKKPCFVEIGTDGVAMLFLDRPRVHNALDEPMIDGLLEHLNFLDAQTQVRVVLITSTGEHFCAGADFDWLAAHTGKSAEAVGRLGSKLAELMRSLYELSKPTIALVPGVAYGGGAGLVACCDIALASHDARFCFSEVRFGLIPATISPFVVRAIGARAARRYFLTADKFSADEAHRLGLVHEVMTAGRLRAGGDQLAGSIIAGGPNALKRTKELVDRVAAAPLGPQLISATAQWFADTLQTDEAQEGIAAFLEKRKAKWVADASSRP
jgi:methylglutaconyl-CoA hydratase